MAYNSNQNWSIPASRELLDLACSALGVTYQELSLVRFGTNAIYKLTEPALSARVSRPGADLAAAKREIAVTRWLVERGFATVSVIDSLTPEPFPVYDSFVSFWPWVEFDAAQPSPVAFAAKLADLHKVSEIYPHPLPPWNPMELVNHHLLSLRKSGTISATDLDLLRRWHDWIAERIYDHRSEIGEGLLHGDAHIGNCLLTHDQAMLLDFDFVCSGPREWDLIPQTLGPRRFGRSREQYSSFAEAYGFDVTKWAGFKVAVLARELLITCWRLEVEAISPVRSEGTLRMHYWRRKPEPPRWRSF